MKKFMEEFKAFALRGNVMDMAVGVIIGGAFSGIVTSLTDNFINPILNDLEYDNVENVKTYVLHITENGVNSNYFVFSKRKYLQLTSLL